MDTAPASESTVRSAAAIFGLTFVAAAVGAATSMSAPEFYAQLTKPSWAPPPTALFGPVWTVLYMLMALAAWMAIRDEAPARSASLLRLYIAQLALNVLWTWLFFRWRLGAVASADVLVLCALAIVLTWRCSQAGAVAGVLMLPYALWTAFASVVTFAMWRLNPPLL